MVWYIDILIPSLSGLVGISLGAVINLWAQKRALRDEQIFSEKKEICEKLMEILKEEFLLYKKIIEKGHIRKEDLKGIGKIVEKFGEIMVKVKIYLQNIIKEEYYKYFEEQSRIFNGGSGGMDSIKKMLENNKIFSDRLNIMIKGELKI